jgi:hypothetical protein
MLTWWRASPGETVVFDKVMLVGDKDNTTGTVFCVPLLPALLCRAHVYLLGGFQWDNHISREPL